MANLNDPNNLLQLPNGLDTPNSNPIAKGEKIHIDTDGKTGNLQDVENHAQALADAFDEYPGASQDELQNAIVALPALNPNHYYERLAPNSGLGAIASSYSVPASGDAPIFAFVPLRNSIGGILADVPFENLFQGQMQLQSDTDCLFEINARFFHYAGLPNEFIEERVIHKSLDANEPATIDLVALYSEVVVSLTDEITQDQLDTPFPYKYEFVFTCFDRTSLTTRIAAELTNVSLIKPALIFKQARQPIGPRGPQGAPGTTTQFAALANEDTLYTIDNQPFSAVSSPLEFDLTFPTEENSLSTVGAYGLLEIGTSTSQSGTDITRTLVLASSVEAGTQADPFDNFTISSSGARTSNSFQLYRITDSQYGYLGGSNRPYLRSVRGINFGTNTSATQQGFIRNVDGSPLPDVVASVEETPAQNVTLPTAQKDYVYRIVFAPNASQGWLYGVEVNEDSLLIATQDNPATNSLTGWTIVQADTFIFTQVLSDFEDQLDENVINRLSTTATADTTFYLGTSSLPTSEAELGTALMPDSFLTGGASQTANQLADHFLFIKIPSATVQPSFVNTTLRFQEREPGDGGAPIRDVLLNSFFRDITASISDAETGFLYLISDITPLTTDTATFFRYRSNHILAVFSSTREVFITFNPNVVSIANLMGNVHLSFMSQDVRDAISAGKVSPDQRRKIAQIEENTSQSNPQRINVTFYWREAFANPSNDLDDYFSSDDVTAIPPHFSGRRSVDVLVPDNWTITGAESEISTPGATATLQPQRFDNLKLYRLSLPATSITNPNASFDFWHPFGTVEVIDNYGLSENVEIDLENLSDNIRHDLTSPPTHFDPRLEQFASHITTDIIDSSEFNDAPNAPDLGDTTLAPEIALFFAKDQRSSLANERNEFPQVRNEEGALNISGVDFSSTEYHFFADPSVSVNTDFPDSGNYISRTNINISNANGSSAIADDYRKIYIFDLSSLGKFSHNTNVARDILFALGSGRTLGNISDQAILVFKNPGTLTANSNRLISIVGQGDGAQHTYTTQMVAQTTNGTPNAVLGGTIHGNVVQAKFIIPGDITGALTITLDVDTFFAGIRETTHEQQTYEINDVEGTQSAETLTFPLGGGFSDQTFNVSYNPSETISGTSTRVITVDLTSTPVNNLINYVIVGYPRTETRILPLTAGDGDTIIDIPVTDPSTSGNNSTTFTIAVLPEDEDDTSTDPFIKLLMLIDNHVYDVPLNRRASAFDHQNIFLNTELTALTRLHVLRWGGVIPDFLWLRNNIEPFRRVLGYGQIIPYKPTSIRFDIDGDLRIRDLDNNSFDLARLALPIELASQGSSTGIDDPIDAAVDREGNPFDFDDFSYFIIQCTHTGPNESVSRVAISDAILNLRISESLTMTITSNNPGLVFEFNDAITDLNIIGVPAPRNET